MRKILITGGAGFIGGHVVSRLLVDGAQVKVIDNLSTGTLANLADARRLGLADLDLLVYDIRTDLAGDVIRAWQPEVIVHLAAQVSLPAAWPEPDSCSATSTVHARMSGTAASWPR